MCDVLEALESGTSEQVIAEVKGKVLEICKRFPVYG
jgi:glycine hydroxymethyltransferase